MEVQITCRACLDELTVNNKDDFQSVFKSMKRIFTELTLIQISDDDDLPKCLCSKCSVLLHAFQSFKETCIKSDISLRNTIHLKEEFEDLEFTTLSDIQPIRDVKIEDDCNVTSDAASERGDDLHQQASDTEDEVVVEPKETIVHNKRPKRVPSVAKDKVRNKKKIKKRADTFLCERDGCNRSFTNRQNLEVHLLTHDGKRTKTCDICDKTFFDVRGMVRHKMTHHCDTVNTSHSAPRKKRTKNEFKCIDCRSTFRIREHYEIHIRRHQLGASVYSCELCNKVMDSARAIKRHMVTHENRKDEDKAKCNVCNKYFSTADSLLTHMKLHNKNSFKHICDQCGKACASLGLLNYHKIIHREAEIECPQCTRKFKTNARLNTHIREVHERISRATACTICNKKLSNNDALLRHCRSFHTVYTTEENLVNCNLCSFKGKSKDSIKNHMLMHTDERNYPCTQCPKTFRKGAALKKHSYFHSGERPIHCDICNKGFYQKCALDIHMNIHKRQWIAEGQQGIELHVYPKNKKKIIYNAYDSESE